MCTQQSRFVDRLAKVSALLFLSTGHALTHRHTPGISVTTDRYVVFSLMLFAVMEEAKQHFKKHLLSHSKTE